MNDDWVSNYSPADLVVTKGSKYYYATFDKAGDQNICLARSENPYGPYKMWNGTDEAWKQWGSTTVWKIQLPFHWLNIKVPCVYIICKDMI